MCVSVSLSTLPDFSTATIQLNIHLYITSSSHTNIHFYFYLLIFPFSVSSEDETFPLVGDIPSDLSADDQPDPLMFIPIPTATAESVSSVSETAASALVVEVLKELDKDYMVLRSRLVNLIQQQGQVLGQGQGQVQSQGQGQSVTVTMAQYAPLTQEQEHPTATATTTTTTVGNSEENQSLGDVNTTSATTSATVVSHPVSDSLHSEEQELEQGEKSTLPISGKEKEKDKQTVTVSKFKYWPSRQLVTVD